MELCKGDLFDVILEKGPIKDENLLKHLFSQISGALEHLHTQASYAHLDIKLENILIGNDYQLKLSDFGFATGVN